MEVESKPIQSVTPYARNPRKNDEAVAKVAASLKEYGWQQPIVVDADGVIIAGHTRLQAAQRLGMDEVPVAVASDLTPEQVKAYRLADNRVAQEADWDNDLLKLELADLKEFEFDLELTGFDKGELDALLAEETEGLTDPDEVTEPPETPVTVRGDIWELGNHRLMCGDSTSIDDIDALICGEKPQVLFTSPPYGVGLEYASYNDSFESTRSLVSAVLVEWSRFVTDYIVLNWGDIVSGREINGTDFPSQFSWLPHYDSTLRDCGWFLWSQRIWVKPHARVSAPWCASSNRAATDWEYVFTWSKGCQSYKERAAGSHFGVIDTTQEKQTDTLEKHPGAFPVALPKRVVATHSNKCGYIVDPFSGTGTIIIASEMLSRRCAAMEIDAKYCDIAVNRWQDFTGKEATLDGKTYAEVRDART